MRRLVLLIGFAFLVLTGSTIVGVQLAEQGARERRAERFGRSVFESFRRDGERHRQALGAEELAELEARRADLDTGVTLVRLRAGENRFELAYCLESGEALQLWVPDPNPRKRARLFFEAPDDAPAICSAQDG